MAKNTKKPARAAAEKNKTKAPLLSPRQKNNIWGVVFIGFALILFLSLLSYSESDSNGYVTNTLSDVTPKAGIKNWLNIFGVYLSHIFIDRGLGYVSFLVPIILAAWGISFFIDHDRTKLIIYSNVALFFAILTSVLMGVIIQNPAFEFIKEYQQLSGDVGMWLGKYLEQAIGFAGSVISIISLFLIVFIVGFDIKLQSVVEFFKDKTVETIEDFKERREELLKNREQEKPSSNLEKAVRLRKEEEVKKTKTPEVKAQVPKQEIEPAPEKISKGIKGLFGLGAKEEVVAEQPEEKPELNTSNTDSELIPKTAEIKINRAQNERKKKEQEKLENQETPEPETPQFDDDSDEEDWNTVDRAEEAVLPDPWEEKINYRMPDENLLGDLPEDDVMVADEELRRNADLLKEKLALFDIEIQKIDVTPGPVVTLYEIVPAPGVKISRIVGLENDIALALAARGIRIIAPIPGKSAIGVEIPNAKASMVVARMVLPEAVKSKMHLPMALGKTISGEVCLADLSTMPHVLVAGATGAGKSVGINMMISSLLYSKHPSEVKFAIIDPKKIELTFYKKLKYHYLAVCPDIDENIITTPANAILLLKSCVTEMEKRYDKLAAASVRNIIEYNTKVNDPVKKPKDKEGIKHHHMPYIVVVIDELADLMITAGKEVEEPIARLAQLARAVGIHLIVATQRPSVNVITGTIKANFPARIAYQVASKIDSRTILDMNGAEQLLGRGDMLFLPGGAPKPQRVQNAYISTEEVESITEYIYKEDGYSKPYHLPSVFEIRSAGGGGTLSDFDEFFEEAARVVVNAQQGSVSLLQRRLKLGYSRAARIVDQLEQAGIVGPNEGSKARRVIVENEEELETVLRTLL